MWILFCSSTKHKVAVRGLVPTDRRARPGEFVNHTQRCSSWWSPGRPEDANRRFPGRIAKLRFAIGSPLTLGRDPWVSSTTTGDAVRIGIPLILGRDPAISSTKRKAAARSEVPQALGRDLGVSSTKRRPGGIKGDFGDPSLRNRPFAPFFRLPCRPRWQRRIFPRDAKERQKQQGLARRNS